MTKIKFCGLSRPCDIKIANKLNPEYIGFVFASKSKRFVTPGNAVKLKQLLNPNIKAVGVFVNENPENIACLLNRGIIDMPQLHGNEQEADIKQLRQLTDRPIIKAFRIESERSIEAANCCTADYVLLDSGAGTGKVFDWKFIEEMRRPYFLAGGLGIDNVETALKQLHPFAVDVSSGVETNGVKDKVKMEAFLAAVRKEERI